MSGASTEITTTYIQRSTHAYMLASSTLKHTHTHTHTVLKEPTIHTVHITLEHTHTYLRPCTSLCLSLPIIQCMKQKKVEICTQAIEFVMYAAIALIGQQKSNSYVCVYRFVSVVRNSSAYSQHAMFAFLLERHQTSKNLQDSPCICVRCLDGVWLCACTLEYMILLACVPCGYVDHCQTVHIRAKIVHTALRPTCITYRPHVQHSLNKHLRAVRSRASFTIGITCHIIAYEEHSLDRLIRWQPGSCIAVISD